MTLKLHEIHRAANEAGIKAAERCPSRTTPRFLGFAFLKFSEKTPWGLWAKKRGLSIKSARGQVMMIRQYDACMPRKIAYTEAYAEFLKTQGIKVEVKIDRGEPCQE